MLRRRRSSPRLYWRLRRPRPRIYARAAAKLIIYRIVAAAAASLAITLNALLGAIAGNINFPRWSSLISIHGQTINSAISHAKTDLTHWARTIHSQTINSAISHAITDVTRWVPAFMVLGLILVSIPRAHQWIFNITMFGGLALGYYQRHLPPLPQSTVAADITKRSAALAIQIPQHLPVSSSLTIAVLPLAAVVIVTGILERSAYILTVRTTSFIPRRPISHYRSTFRAVSVTRRLAAAAITAGLLAVDIWIVRNIRTSLSGAHYGTFLLKHSQFPVTDWVLAAVIVALILCTPRPNGIKWLLVTILSAITAYAFLPDVNLLRIPSLMSASPNSLWALIIAYLFVTGFGFDLIIALLDWPIDT